jgi:hypothetical protein
VVELYRNPNIKYSRKFKLFFGDGKLNRVGPGYDRNDQGDLVITTPVVYHPDADQVLIREKKRRERQLASQQAFWDFFFGRD